MSSPLFLVTFSTPVRYPIEGRMREIDVVQASIDGTKHLGLSVLLRASWILMRPAGLGVDALDVELAIVVPVGNIAGAALLGDHAVLPGSAGRRPPREDM